RLLGQGIAIHLAPVRAGEQPEPGPSTGPQRAKKWSPSQAQPAITPTRPDRVRITRENTSRRGGILERFPEASSSSPTPHRAKSTYTAIVRSWLLIAGGGTSRTPPTGTGRRSGRGGCRGPGPRGR